MPLLFPFGTWLNRKKKESKIMTYNNMKKGDDWLDIADIGFGKGR